MNRICSIGRFACLLAELALAGRNPLTTGARSRVRHRLALIAAIAGLMALRRGGAAMNDGTAPGLAS